jgi:uncharacterized protein with von Willebrand factor type A (vWA) domain
MPVFKNPREQAVIVRDKHDHSEFLLAVKSYPPLETLLQANLPEIPVFLEDCFLTFFKPAFEIADDDTLSLSAQARRTLLVEMIETQQYHEVKAQVRPFDKVGAAIATHQVCSAMVGSLEKEMVRLLTDLHEAESQTVEYLREAEALEYVSTQFTGDEAKALYEEAQALRAQAKRSELAARARATEFAEQSETVEDLVRRSARQALEKAEEELSQIMNALRVFGAGLPDDQLYGVKIERSTQDKLALARQVMETEKLRLIAELAGKMINTALYKQRGKVHHNPDEITGVTTGNDLGKLLSSEMFKLGDPYLEMIFYQQYLERSLLVWEMVGHEKEARGPIVLGVDSTGSMGWPLYDPSALQEEEEEEEPFEETDEEEEQNKPQPYTKEIWAKALMFALLTIANKQKRDFCLIYFGKNQRQVKTYRFLKGRATPQELVDAAMHFYASDDTFFDFVLSKVIEITEESAFKRADFVLVTDGEGKLESSMRARYNRVRQDRDMHAYGIYLADIHANKGREMLASLVDAQVSVTDLGKDEAALDLLFTQI